MFSKSRLGMSNRNPFSWVTQEEGIEAMLNNGGNSNAAAEIIMNNHQASWSKRADNDYNVIKKWLDRVLLGM